MNQVFNLNLIVSINFCHEVQKKYHHRLYFCASCCVFLKSAAAPTRKRRRSPVKCKKWNIHSSFCPLSQIQTTAQHYNRAKCESLSCVKLPVIRAALSRTNVHCARQNIINPTCIIDGLMKAKSAESFVCGETLSPLPPLI